MAGELASRAAHDGLGNVKLLGSLTVGDLKRAYRQADIFLFPSAWEGSPKVILEASACGLPVIVRNSYAPESVLHGITGYQAASDDEIFSRLEALIASEDLRRRLGHAGRSHSQNFDWDLITKKWAQTFAEIAQGGVLRQAS